MTRKKAAQSASQIVIKKRAENITNAYERIRAIIENVRNNVTYTVNTEVVRAYGHIGKEIIEEEQKGKKCAGYGEFILKNFPERLVADFGKGFDQSN